MTTTMHIYRKLLRSMVAAAVALLQAAGAVSCSDDEPKSNVPNDSWYDVVTLESLSNTGSMFTMQKDGDSDIITYTSAYAFPNDKVLKVGDRLIIMYLRADDAAAYTSGPIDLYGYRRMDNVPQQVTVEPDFNAGEWASEAIEAQTLTRTGHYINMQARLSCYKADDPAQWAMVADPLTLGDDYPQLYVVYKAKSPGENFAKGYASWDMSAVWSLATCCGVKINYMSPSGLVTRTFSK